MGGAVNEDDVKRLTDQAQWDQVMTGIRELGSWLTRLRDAYTSVGFDDHYATLMAQQTILKGLTDQLFKRDQP